MALDAWVGEHRRDVSTDTAAAYETQSITFNRLRAKYALSDFISEFDMAAKSKTTGPDQISSMPSVMVGTLAQVTMRPS